MHEKESRRIPKFSNVRLLEIWVISAHVERFVNEKGPKLALHIQIFIIYINRVWLPLFVSKKREILKRNFFFIIINCDHKFIINNTISL